MPTREEIEKAARDGDNWEWDDIKGERVADQLAVDFAIQQVNAVLEEAEQLAANHGCEEFGYCGCEGKIARKIRALKIEVKS